MEPATPEVTIPTPEIPKTSKDNHWITTLSVAVFILLSLSAVAFLYFQNQQLKSILASYQVTPSPTATISPTPLVSQSPSATASATPKTTLKACTQEAKLCPDGSYVGRTGANCEFAPCPTPL